MSQETQIFMMILEDPIVIGYSSTVLLNLQS